ncbi:MAG: hypothetical protein IKO05_10720 [Selenomonadaceae bacterium]|nr:hypothetical protein [Selenomonadaceae bacterium]
MHDTKIGYWATGLATFAYPTLEKICGDGGWRESFVFEAYKYFGLRVEISKKLKGHGRQVLPKRWIVDVLCPAQSFSPIFQRLRADCGFG